MYRQKDFTWSNVYHLSTDAIYDQGVEANLSLVLKKIYD